MINASLRAKSSQRSSRSTHWEQREGQHLCVLPAATISPQHLSPYLYCLTYTRKGNIPQTHFSRNNRRLPALCILITRIKKGITLCIPVWRKAWLINREKGNDNIIRSKSKILLFTPAEWPCSLFNYCADAVGKELFIGNTFYLIILIFTLSIFPFPLFNKLKWKGPTYVTKRQIL